MSPSRRRVGQIVFGRMPNGRNRRDSSPCVSLRGGRSSFGPCHSFHRPSSSPISASTRAELAMRSNPSASNTVRTSASSVTPGSSSGRLAQSATAADRAASPCPRSSAMASSLSRAGANWRRNSEMNDVRPLLILIEEVWRQPSLILSFLAQRTRSYFRKSSSPALVAPSLRVRIRSTTPRIQYEPPIPKSTRSTGARRQLAITRIRLQVVATLRLKDAGVGTTALANL
jgi:hypothetical protein